jgi:general secretion pathway protein K
VRRSRRAGRERGVALLSALFTVALLTVVVIEMTDATMVHTNLNRNAGSAMAAQLLARSAAIAGEALLLDDSTNPQSITCPQNIWAMPLFGVPAGSGIVGLQISDESGKLDLNSVQNDDYRAAVERLFSSLDLDPSLVDRVRAWTAPPGDATMATGAASDYCALAMPCAPRQQPLNSLEELLLIRGFDDRAVARLRPYVTALPRGGSKAQRVNAATAKPLVLEAIGCESGDTLPPCPVTFGGDDEKVDEWKKQEFENWTANCTPAAKSLLTTNSDVFSILASGTVGDVTQTLRTTVRRQGDKVTRLWWQERPLSEAMPVEIR